MKYRFIYSLFKGIQKSHTFMEIDHEIMSTVILFFRWSKKECCQLQAKICVRTQEKRVVRQINRLDMTIAVDWDSNQTVSRLKGS